MFPLLLNRDSNNELCLRLQSIGYHHVAASFGGIMKMYKDGNKSRNEAYQGVGSW